MSTDPSAVLCPGQQVRKSRGPWRACPGCDPGLRAPVSSAPVLSAGIRMSKRLVLWPGCIHAPCLQVCASVVRHLSRCWGENAQIQVLSRAKNELLAATAAAECPRSIVFDSVLDLKTICNSKPVLGFSHWLIFCQHFMTMTSVLALACSVLNS